MERCSVLLLGYRKEGLRVRGGDWRIRGVAGGLQSLVSYLTIQSSMYAIQHASVDSLSKSGFSVVAREGRECGWLLFVGGLDMIMVIIPTPSQRLPRSLVSYFAFLLMTDPHHLPLEQDTPTRSQSFPAAHTSSTRPCTTAT